MPKNEPPAGIHARGLTFTYPGARRSAFGPLDFDFEPGRAVLILGPSGCGKSTLALCMNGIIPALIDGEMSGEIRVDGVDPRALGPARMAGRAGILFQDPDSQICTLTVADEVAFGPENLGRPPDAVERATEAALAAVGLQDLGLDRAPSSLSGGEKQRLALAAALALEPGWLVLDEPTAQLDPHAAAELFHHLARLRDQSVGIVLIEHRIDEVAGWVDEVLILDAAGRIERSGPPRRTLAATSAGIWAPEAVRIQATVPSLADFPACLTPGELIQATALSLRSSASPVAMDAPEPAPAEPLLRLEHGTYRYPGGTAVLADAALTVRAGELHALVGPNGSGKTTLGLVVAGLISPAPGAILRRRAGAERVGYVFQNPDHQFITTSVAEELAYGLVRQDVSDAEQCERVQGMLDRFALTGYERRHPLRLSGGQKRRLSVAVMLIDEPALLVLDEPTFGQDPRTAAALTAEMERLKAGGIGLLVITHDMRLVAGLADRVTALAGGRVRFNGSPRALFRDPDLCAELALIPPPAARIAIGLRAEGIPAGDWIQTGEAIEGLRRLTDTRE